MSSPLTGHRPDASAARQRSRSPRLPVRTRWAGCPVSPVISNTTMWIAGILADLLPAKASPNAVVNLPSRPRIRT